MVKIRISLNVNEAEALAKLAYTERREPHAQAAFFVRQSLESRGLLPKAINTRPPHRKSPTTKKGATDGI